MSRNPEKHVYSWGRKKELLLAKMVLRRASLDVMAKQLDKSKSSICHKKNKTGFICLTVEESDYYGVQLSKRTTRKISIMDCPEKVQRMRKLYPY